MADEIFVPPSLNNFYPIKFNNDSIEVNSRIVAEGLQYTITTEYSIPKTPGTKIVIFATGTSIATAVCAITTQCFFKGMAIEAPITEAISLATGVSFGDYVPVKIWADEIRVKINKKTCTGGTISIYSCETLWYL